MTPKTYLLLLSIILLLVGILGFAHVIGPTPEESVFGTPWFFNTVENIGHTLVGLVSLWAGLYLAEFWQKRLALIGAIAGTFAGLYSLLISQYILGAHFENPADTIFHLVIGVLGWWAYLSTPKERKLFRR